MEVLGLCGGSHDKAYDVLYRGGKPLFITDSVYVVVTCCLQVNLVGGYYDAGDNVKFGLPMAFTITMLSWSVVEYGHFIGAAGELGYTHEAIKWGTDYLIKAHPEPNVLWGEVQQHKQLFYYTV